METWKKGLETCLYLLRKESLLSLIGLKVYTILHQIPFDGATLSIFVYTKFI